MKHRQKRNQMKNSIRRQKLLDAAERLFLSRGFASVSTTDIAREAGCNHALIHYYFGNKEDLFRQLFLGKIRQVLATLMNYLEVDRPLFELTDRLIDAYFDLLNDNPNLPFFIINELTLNPDRRKYLRENFVDKPITKEVYYRVDDMIKREIAEGRIRPVSTKDLLLDIMGLTVSSFIAFPAYRDFVDNTDEAAVRFIADRRQEVKTIIRNGLIAR